MSLREFEGLLDIAPAGQITSNDTPPIISQWNSGLTEKQYEAIYGHQHPGDAPELSLIDESGNLTPLPQTPFNT